MTATERAKELTIVAARAGSERKAQEIIALDVSEQLVLTDVFVIMSGRNARHVKAIVDAVEESLHKESVKAIRREGMGEAHWVLLDFGDIVVHVQQEEDRVFYALERLWKDCPDVELPEDARGGDGDASEYDLIDEFGFAAGTYSAGDLGAGLDGDVEADADSDAGAADESAGTNAG